MSVQDHSRVFALMEPPVPAKLLQSSTVQGILLSERVDITLQLRVFRARSPSFGELGCVAGRLAFESLSYPSLGWTRQSGEKVGSRLLFGTLETQTSKVFFGSSRGSEKDLMPLV